MNKYYCTQHKKYCNYIKRSADDQLYDSDHECSDGHSQIYDDSCSAEHSYEIQRSCIHSVILDHRIVNRRHVFIMAPGVHHNEGTLKQYLSTDMNINCK